LPWLQAAIKTHFPNATYDHPRQFPARRGPVTAVALRRGPQESRPASPATSRPGRGRVRE
jgi:hypothetical protein